ncbi:MAG: hypothetical protein A3B99_03770 [Candidatus Yanofskybacteria bacterium RIFCSPHIGHO2_02_FULL_44_12b]|nr:MAG: hypothetical protein A2659_01070 [Candidatus Yanofskybacteria bacterium RIFCSPHIGHO2_01_FULL_44_24]OGN15638.1 MAG: hypothetical protein A3B99_03770 [Candidatus Yanofskybacteria bacterium RIFCSPHIGHO2_02_FULL_44_12b]
MEESYFKDTGKYGGPWGNDGVWIVQKGVKRCTREGCNYDKLVWRQGWHNLPNPEFGRWRRLSQKRESSIDALPDFYLMG